MKVYFLIYMWMLISFVGSLVKSVDAVLLLT